MQIPRAICGKSYDVWRCIPTGWSRDGHSDDENSLIKDANKINYGSI